MTLQTAVALSPPPATVPQWGRTTAGIRPQTASSPVVDARKGRRGEGTVNEQGNKEPTVVKVMGKHFRQ